MPSQRARSCPPSQTFRVLLWVHIPTLLLFLSVCVSALPLSSSWSLCLLIFLGTLPSGRNQQAPHPSWGLFLKIARVCGEWMSLSSQLVGRAKGQLQIQSWGGKTYGLHFVTLWIYKADKIKTSKTKVTPVFPVKMNILPRALLTLPNLYLSSWLNFELILLQKFCSYSDPRTQTKASFLDDQTHPPDSSCR